MGISRDRFRKALNESYSKGTLFKIFKRYFLDWIAEGYIGSNLGLFEISLISESTNKQTFLELMEQMYSKEEVFKGIFSSLPKEVQEVFESIAWKGKFKIKDRDIYLKDEEGYNIKSELKDEFKEETTKDKIVQIIKDYLPNFEHIETGKSLDSKM